MPTTTSTVHAVSNSSGGAAELIHDSVHGERALETQFESRRATAPASSSTHSSTTRLDIGGGGRTGPRREAELRIMNRESQPNLVSSRALPLPAQASVAHGTWAAEKVAETEDMIRYRVDWGGSKTELIVMNKLSSDTALPRPPGLFEGRSGVLFLDRDGVINKAASFLNRPEDVRSEALIPGVLDAAIRLEAAAIGQAWITNQGGYQLGKMSFEQMLAVNAEAVRRVVEAGGRVDAVFICPFQSPLTALDDQELDARKPAAGMTTLARRWVEEAGSKVLGMAGDQRTDGLAAQAAGVPFIAIKDPEHGRWEVEGALAKRGVKAIPKLSTHPSSYREVRDLASAVKHVTAGPMKPHGSRAAKEASSPLGVEFARDLPPAWLSAATGILHASAPTDTDGRDYPYDERFVAHGEAAAEIVESARSQGLIPLAMPFDSDRELLLLNLFGYEDLAIALSAFDPKSGKVRPLGKAIEEEGESLYELLGWDGRSPPSRLARAVRVPREEGAGAALVGFATLSEFAPAPGFEFGAFAKADPGRVPKLGPVVAALEAAPAALESYRVELSSDQTQLALRHGDTTHIIQADPGKRWVRAGWSNQQSIQDALFGLGHPRADREAWRKTDDAVDESQFARFAARDLLWLEQSDGRRRFLAFSRVAEAPKVLELRGAPVAASLHET